MLEAETVREQYQPETTTSAREITPVKVKRLGHVVFTVSDIERTTKFWTEIMGFQVSDRNEYGMVFLRQGSDHHTIALVPAKTKDELPKDGRPGFHHCALEVESVSALFKIRDFLRAKGVPIVYEGRRGAGGNPGSGVSRSRRFQHRALRLNGSGWLGRQEPPVRAVETRHDSRRGGRKSAARREL